VILRLGEKVIVRVLSCAQSTSMRLAIVVVAFICAACGPEAPAPAAPPANISTPSAPGVSTEFMAPSGNIACVYTPAGGTAVYQTADGRAELKCDRSEPEYVRIVLPENGPARIEPTDERGCCSGETTQYGQDWSAGPFSCDVTESGLICVNREQHGFTLSRSRADVH